MRPVIECYKTQVKLIVAFPWFLRGADGCVLEEKLGDDGVTDGGQAWKLKFCRIGVGRFDLLFLVKQELGNKKKSLQYGIYGLGGGSQEV